MSGKSVAAVVAIDRHGDHVPTSEGGMRLHYGLYNYRIVFSLGPCFRCTSPVLEKTGARDYNFKFACGVLVTLNSLHQSYLDFDDCWIMYATCEMKLNCSTYTTVIVLCIYSPRPFATPSGPALGAEP
jgi:hypothetical protein